METLDYCKFAAPNKILNRKQTVLCQKLLQQINQSIRSLFSTRDVSSIKSCLMINFNEQFSPNFTGVTKGLEVYKSSYKTEKTKNQNAVKCAFLSKDYFTSVCDIHTLQYVTESKQTRVDRKT